ncbi:MAG: hypothetical protein NDJ89_04670 [Oligoflexia bacterium]|nr:hypothetical protein [Oligoflexia bacterium]
MRKSIFLPMGAFLCAALAAQASDIRDKAVLNSPMVKAIQKGLRAEQGLTCSVTRDESGERMIQYFIEEGLSKFSVLLLCDNGQSALVRGVIGDGGQTRVEEFRMVWAQ